MECSFFEISFYPFYIVDIVRFVTCFGQCALVKDFNTSRDHPEGPLNALLPMQSKSALNSKIDVTVMTNDTRCGS